MFLLAMDLASPHVSDEKKAGVNIIENQEPDQTEEDLIYEICLLWMKWMMKAWLNKQLISLDPTWAYTKNSFS